MTEKRLFLMPGEITNEERLDRLAHSMQFDPEDCTAEAASSRKYGAHPGEKIGSSYVADLNGYRVTQDMLRHPQGAHWSELVHIGTVVRTSYNTGPYVVEQINEHIIYGLKTISLVCSLPDAKRRKDGQMMGEPDGWLNEIVAMDGRLLKLFKANEDEVFVEREFQFKQNIQTSLI